MSAPFNTEGWDLVYSGNLDVCNQQLAESFREGGYPTSIDFESSGLWKVNGMGEFAPWQFVTGGGPELLDLRMPFSGGSVTIRAEEEVTVPLEGCALIVQIGLRFIDDGTKGRELVFDLDPDHQGEVVRLVDVEDPSGQLQEYRAFLQAAINRFLIENESRITYAVLAVGPKGEQSGPEWQIPTAERFTYVNRNSTTDSFIALLMMTQNRPPAELEASPSALPNGYNGGALVRTPLFMQEVLLPAFPEMISGDAKASDFAIDTRSGDIYATRTIKGYGIKAGAMTYYPKYSTLTMVPTGDGVRIEMKGKFSMGMGIELRFDILSTYALERVSGRNAVTLVLNGKPEVHTQEHVPWYDYLLMIGGLTALAIFEIITNVIRNDLTHSLVRISKDLPVPETGLFDVDWTGYRSVQLEAAEMSPSALRLSLEFPPTPQGS